MRHWLRGTRLARLAFGVVVIALILPAAAQASSAGVPTKPTLNLRETFKVGSRLVTIPDRQLEIAGTVGAYAPGQTVSIETWLSGRPFMQRTVALTPIDGQAALQFKTKLKLPRAGVLSIRVIYAGTAPPVTATTTTSPTTTTDQAPATSTAEIAPFTLKGKVAVVRPQASPGSTGLFVKLIQQQLLALHFYLQPSGVYDGYTQLAVDAYHRMLGRGYSTLLDPGTLKDLLRGVGSFHVRFQSQGEHAEGDLSDQLLALTNGGKVQWIFPISSGKPSTPTVLGSWQIYLRTPGYLPDGMYYSDFFIRGYAIHGYDPAPNYPASHGCMRLPIPDAIFVFNWLKLGDWVDTYYT